MAFQSIEKLQGTHPGEEAWIFGKGPSLDAFEMSQAGPLRICINESLWRVPEPSYFFAHDERPIGRIADQWPAGCKAILEASRAQYAGELGVSRQQIFQYTKSQYSSAGVVRNRTIDRQPDQLIGLSGTVHSAIDFCRHLGVGHVQMVAFDGAGGYATSLELETPVGGGQHDRIRADSERLLEALGLSYTFVRPALPSHKSSFDYQGLYDRLRADGYHEADDHTSHLAKHFDWLCDNLEFSTVLDIGCSSGQSVSMFQKLGYQAQGVDVSQVAVGKAEELGRPVQRASATELPFEDDSFDLVCSADVFEHLHPDDAEQACREAARVAKHFVFMKIAEHVDTTERWKELAGHPLHLTTRPIEWWKRQFQRYGDIVYSAPEVFCLRK